MVAICPNKRQQDEMKTDLRHLLDWKTYLTHGVDYPLDLYSGSLSSVLFQEMVRTSKAGEGKGVNFFSGKYGSNITILTLFFY